MTPPRRRRIAAFDSYTETIAGLLDFLQFGDEYEQAEALNALYGFTDDGAVSDNTERWRVAELGLRKLQHYRSGGVTPEFWDRHLRSRRYRAPALDFGELLGLILEERRAEERP